MCYIFGTRLCVPNSGGLREKIMEEVHYSSYTIHPGSTKMYQDLKEFFWWEGMKKDVLEFVGPLPDGLFYLDLLQFHGKLRNNKQYLAPLLRLSIDP